jgi:hypothetical protein
VTLPSRSNEKEETWLDGTGDGPQSWSLDHWLCSPDDYEIMLAARRIDPEHRRAANLSVVADTNDWYALDRARLVVAGLEHLRHPMAICQSGGGVLVLPEETPAGLIRFWGRFPVCLFGLVRSPLELPIDWKGDC